MQRRREVMIARGDRAAGHAFFHRAREAIDVIAAGRESVTDIVGLKSGTLSIGTVHTLAAFLDLPSHIARYHIKSPGIEVRLRQGDTTGLVDLLLYTAARLDVPDDWHVVGRVRKHHCRVGAIHQMLEERSGLARRRRPVGVDRAATGRQGASLPVSAARARPLPPVRSR